MKQFLTILLALTLGACSIEESKETALVSDIPSPKALADSLQATDLKVVKWAVIDSAIQRTQPDTVNWKKELEFLLKNNVNHLRYRDSYSLTDSVRGSERIVRFDAASEDQEVRWMEVRMHGTQVTYYGVEKSRDNLLSNARILFEFEPPYYTLQLLQQVDQVFENTQYVKAFMLEGSAMGRGVFEMAGSPMPVEVVLGKDLSHLCVVNGVEQVPFVQDDPRNDSLIFRSDAYDAHFALSAVNDSVYRGWWHNQKSDHPYRIAFELTVGPTHRFEANELPNHDISGDHALLMYNYDGTPRDTYLLRLDQEHHKLYGSILTETGDYRFLNGAVIGDSMFLSTMDGTHAYLVKGRIDGDQLTGTFTSNPHRSKNWETLPGVQPNLRDAATITTATAEVSFAFPDANGTMHSLSDERYQNKPVVLSIMGTWCSNCKDEAEFLKRAYAKYHADGLQIVALDFELVKDSARSFANIQRHVEAMDIPYPVLLACTGTNKERSAAAVPFLSGVNSYPTMVVLDRNHRIVKIHTGFSGPATGEASYRAFEEEYFDLFASLLK